MSKYTFHVVSDLYEAGAGEDGPFIAECYFLQAENEFGSRWNHFKTFSGVEVVCDEYGETRFMDIRKDAESRANALLRRVEGSDINFDFWTETYPAYGSPAYCS